MVSVSRRNFRIGWAAAAVAAAFALTATAAADERQPVPQRKTPQSVGHNEIVVAKNADLRDQFRECWNVPAMTQREDVNVHVIVELRPNRTVRKASIVDYAFSVTDPHRRAVAQSARHALLSARCNPLRVPDDVADNAERITLTFNPAEIFQP